MAQRGTAILALVMALADMRPVELWTYTAMDGGEYRVGYSNIMIRINSAPLCLSEACYALTSGGLCRNLTYDFARHHTGFTGGWCERHESEESLREMVGASPQDLLIRAADEKDKALFADPIKWVNDHLERLRNQEQELA